MHLTLPQTIDISNWWLLCGGAALVAMWFRRKIWRAICFVFTGFVENMGPIVFCGFLLCAVSLFAWAVYTDERDSRKKAATVAQSHQLYNQTIFKGTSESWHNFSDGVAKHSFSENLCNIIKFVEQHPDAANERMSQLTKMHIIGELTRGYDGNNAFLQYHVFPYLDKLLDPYVDDEVATGVNKHE